MEGSILSSLLNVGAALVVVLLLAVVLLRFGAPLLQRLQTPGGSQIEVVELKALDRQHRVALLRVRQEDFLVALGSGSPCLLRSWPAVNPAGNLPGTNPPGPSPPTGSPPTSDTPT